MQSNKYYIKTIALDEFDIIIDYIRKHKDQKAYWFIFNTNKRSEHKDPGHWIAIFIWKQDKWFEYFNPFGENPTNNIMKEIKRLMYYIQTLFPYLLKFKINRIKQQGDLSTYCGLFCIKFLLSRSSGISFKETTNYPLIKKNEKLMKWMKNFIEKFGFI